MPQVDIFSYMMKARRVINNMYYKMKTIMFASLIVAMILPFSMADYADANEIKEKSLIKEKIKDKIKELADKDKEEKNLDVKYSPEEYGIPYNLMFEDNNKLVVGIDAQKALEFQKEYSKDQVKADLDTDTELEVRYFKFELESNVRGGDALTHGMDSATITIVKDDRIITTGHAFSRGDIVNAGLVGGTGCQEIRITKDVNYNNAFADASYGVPIDNPDCENQYINDSIRYKGRIYSVTYGTASDITQNKFIRIAGIMNTGSGYILDTDVTARIDGDVLNDQVIGNYASTSGDSGAPIFSLTGSSSAKLLGQHVGRACEVDLHSGKTYGYWCDSNENGGLKFFSPWDQVETHLGI